MRRFIIAFAIGAALIGVALVGIGFSSHPDSFASLSTFLAHCAALVMGAATIGSGMIGMADGYEKLSRNLAQLLKSRAVETSPASVRSSQELVSSDQRFWSAYRNASLAVAGFMATILVIIFGTVGFSHLAYLACLSTGVAISGIGALLISYRGLRTIRHRQKQVGDSAEAIAAQPEKIDEAPKPQSPPRRGWTIRRAKPRYVAESYRRMLRESAQTP